MEALTAAVVAGALMMAAFHGSTRTARAVRCAPWTRRRHQVVQVALVMAVAAVTLASGLVVLVLAVARVR